MDRFTELETFVTVASLGGFNAAGRQLGKSAPTITRVVAGLEERIGTRLFTRTTRQLALTEAGERLFKDAQRILDDLETAEASAIGAHQEPQGVLSITAPVNFGRQYVAPLLMSFIELHPKVSARTLFVDRVVNLIDEGLDVAVRIGNLPDSSLTALKVGNVRQVVVASPEYLATHGTPSSPDELRKHRIAVSSDFLAGQVWKFEVGTRSQTIPVSPAMRGNTIDSALVAARSGWAITRVLSYQAASEIRSGELVEILGGFEDRRFPVHLVHAEGPLRAAKIRAFIDHAAVELRRQATQWCA